MLCDDPRRLCIDRKAPRASAFVQQFWRSMCLYYVWCAFAFYILHVYSSLFVEKRNQSNSWNDQLMA